MGFRFFETFKRVYCFDEVDAFDSHHHIDGVEVFFASKTSCKVGLTIYRCVVFTAYGATKAIGALADF